jgi:hypothetical protein
VACAWGLTALLVHMAITEFDMGQLFTYFLLLLLALLLHYVVSSVSHLTPVNRRALAKLFLGYPDPPSLRGRLPQPPCPHGRGRHNWHMCTWDQQQVMTIRRMVREENSRNWHLSTYLFATLWKAYLVGCCVKWLFRAIIKQLRWPGSIHLALQARCRPSATATRA